MDVAETGQESEEGDVHGPQRLKPHHVTTLFLLPASRLSVRPPVAWQRSRPLRGVIGRSNGEEPLRPASGRRSSEKHANILNGVGPRK